MRMGLSPARVGAITRGHIGHLFDRINRCHGRREVLATWRTGIRSLRAEPPHTLRGGVQ